MRIEPQRVRNMKVECVSMVVGTRGAVPKKLRKHLDDNECVVATGVLQQSAFLGTTRILRNVLGS